MRKSIYVIILAALLPTSLGVVFLERAFIYAAKTPLPTTASAASEIIDPPGDAVVLYYHERRPYFVTMGHQVHGLIADRVNWVFREAGIPYEWQKIPAKRALEMIRRNTQRACAVGWFKTPDREAFGRFTLPIYLDSPTMAIARADNDQIKSGRPLAETLANYHLRLLRKDGYSYGQFIDEGFKRYGAREILTSADNLGMVKMIHTHRADYFFIAREEAEDLILCAELPIKSFKIIQFSDMPPGNKRYLICSRRVDDMTRLRINCAIKDYLRGSLSANPLSMTATP